MLPQEKIDRLVSELAGKDCIELARLIIAGKENVSEFKLADLLGITINETRHLLYKLQKYNLVTSTRKKDKKKGWYVYYWTFNFVNAKSLLKSLKEDKLLDLRKRLLQQETEDFYTCSKKCRKLSLESSMEYNFKCPECDSLLKEVNKEKVIDHIKKEINILEQELIEELPERVQV